MGESKRANSILKHFMVIGSGTAINMMIGLISTPLITRLVDPTEYGQLGMFTLYANIAEMVLCLGMDQALVRYYYEYDHLEYRRNLLFKCLVLPVIVTIVTAIAFLTLIRFSVIKFEFSFPICMWMCICVFVQLVYRFGLLILRLEYKSKQYSFLNILRKASYLCFVIILSIALKRDYLILLVISTVSSISLCMIISIIFRKEEWLFGKAHLSSIKISQSELLKYAVPFIISMGVTQLFQAIDKISINQYRSYAEVGVYTSAMTLVHIFAIIQTTFNSMWAPMQVEHYTKNPNDHSFYQKGNQIITVIMFFVGFSLILVKDLFAILLGSKYREAAYILPFLIFNPIMYTISETTIGGLVFKKKSNLHVIIALGACMTNFIGNTILVPKLGCRGAAISTGISYIVFFSLRTIIANRYFYTDFKLSKFYLLTAVTCVYAFYNTFHRFDFISLFGYFICVFILVCNYKEIIWWMIRYVREIALKKLKDYKDKERLE